MAAQAQPPASTLLACAACPGPDGTSATALVPSLAAQPKVSIETPLVLMPS